MNKLKILLRSRPLHILVCSGAGVLFIAFSYSPGGSRPGRGGLQSWGASFDPITLSLGVVAVVGAILLYRKWSAEQNGPK